MNKRKIILMTATFLTFLVVSIFSCKKEDSCYDDNFYQQHKNDFCPTDCPGVVGCDGKTYCNECEALRQGIPLK